MPIVLDSTELRSNHFPRHSEVHEKTNFSLQTETKIVSIAAMGKASLMFALAFSSVISTVVEGAEKNALPPLTPLTKGAVERVCARLLSTLPSLPVGDDALQAYVSASDVGRGNYMYRLTMMKGEIDRKERYVFFLGENHLSGPQSYSAGNKVIDQFNVLAVEDLTDAAKRSKSRAIRWLITVGETTTKPLLRLTSALARGHAKISDPEKTVIKLEATHEYSGKMNDALKSHIHTMVALGLYVRSLFGWIAWVIRLLTLTKADLSWSIMTPNVPEAIAVGVNLVTGAYLLVKLERLNAEVEKAKSDPAAKSLGQHSYYMRQGDNHDIVVRRDTDMTAQLIHQFRANPDLNYALVMVGKAHIPGMMKLLRKEHEFDRIPLNLKSESKRGDNNSRPEPAQTESQD